MPRLTKRRSERGATAVIVAVLLTALLGFTAIAVDVGALWWDRKQAQNGADAAALAVAQACAKAEVACDTEAGANAVAQDYADKNRLGADAYSGTVAVDMSTQRVTATVDTTRGHWFAPLIGVGSTDVSARAVATWGTPSRGSFLPLAISQCWFYYQTGSLDGTPPPTGTRFVVPLKSKSGSTDDGEVVCGTHAAHNEAAGGFGWLEQTSTCMAEIDLTNPWIGSDPGASSRDCASVAITVGESVYMPIFDEWRGSGAGTEYHIKGFAVFVVTDYCFGPGMAETTGWPRCQRLPLDSRDRGPNISGTFVDEVGLDEVLSGGGGTNMGTQIARLVD